MATETGKMTQGKHLRLYFLARSLAWRGRLKELDARALLEVEKTLRTAQKDIANRLRAEAEGLKGLSVWRREQDAALNAWADEVLAGTRASLTETVSAATITAGEASLAATMRMASLDGKAGAFRFVGLGAEQVKSWFQDTALGSGALAHWVDTALDNGVKQAILSALRQVAVEGKGTAEAVRRTLTAASDAGFALTRREAITLTCTYIQTANIRAQEAVYRANEHLFTGYRRVGALDNRVCLACALADGAEYGLDEERPALPTHPNCRCLYVPIARGWKDFGLNVVEAEQAVRPWTIREPGVIGAGGRKIKNFGTTRENYEGWWHSLSSGQKELTAIGPERRKLLESGQVKWADLWDKKTGRVKRLDELEGLLSRPRPAAKATGDFANWVGDIARRAEKGNFQATGERRAVGAFSDEVLDFLKGRGIAPAATSITVGDKDIFHALRTAKKDPLPASVWQRLPELLARPKAVYWDLRKPGLVYALDEPEGLGKLVVLLNYTAGRGRKKSSVSTVRTGRKIESLNEFANIRWYEKLQ